MSLPCFTWVLDNSEATLGARLVLLVLAEHAHDDGRESYPALETIARRTRMSRKGARDALRRLVKDGHIAEDGTGPRGQTKWRLLFKEQGVKELPPTDAKGVYLPPDGGVVTSPPREVTTPEPSIEPSIEPSVVEPRARDQDELPADLPEPLRQPALAAMEALKRTADAREQSRPVVLEAVGRAVAANPTKDHLAVAGRVEHWLRWGNGQRKPCRDVVARFRDWLPDSDDVRRQDGTLIAAANGTAARSGTVTVGNTSGREIPDYDEGMIRNGPTP